LLTVAGLHVPVIPLFEVPGRMGGVVPAQIEGSMVKEGFSNVLTVIVTVAGTAQSPAVGVKV
jgi:hypothetical protein